MVFCRAGSWRSTPEVGPRVPSLLFCVVSKTNWPDSLSNRHHAASASNSGIGYWKKNDRLTSDGESVTQGSPPGYCPTAVISVKPVEMILLTLTCPHAPFDAGSRGETKQFSSIVEHTEPRIRSI